MSRQRPTWSKKFEKSLKCSKCSVTHFFSLLFLQNAIFQLQEPEYLVKNFSKDQFYAVFSLFLSFSVRFKLKMKDKKKKPRSKSTLNLYSIIHTYTQNKHKRRIDKTQDSIENLVNSVSSSWLSNKMTISTDLTTNTGCKQEPNCY